MQPPTAAMPEELRPWANGFISEAAFALENDALTHALRMSLLYGPSSSVAVPSPDFLSSSSSSLLPLPIDGSPPLRLLDRPFARIGKKRKSRTSKRSPTTYIGADPANFRQLVQQMTGVGASVGAEGNRAAEDPPLASVHGSCFLPTLDTSAFLLNRLEQSNAIGPVDHGWVLLDVDAVVI